MESLRRLARSLSAGWLLVLPLGVLNLLLLRQNASLSAASDRPLEWISPRLSELNGVSMDGRFRQILYDSTKRYLILTFSPQCPACNASLTNWKTLAGQLDLRRWEVVWISRDALEPTRVFADAHALPGNVLAEVSHRLYEQLGLRAVPRTIVVANDGEVVGSVFGAIDAPAAARVAELLDAPVPESAAASRLGKAVPAQPIMARTRAVDGVPLAAVTLLVFSDFQCPFCRQFSNETLPQIRTEFVKPGVARVAFVHNPLVSIHPAAFGASQAADCAASQGKFWPMHDALFFGPEPVNESGFLLRASNLGLDIPAFKGCLAGAAGAQVRADMALARELAVTGTPTIFIGLTQPDGSVRLTDRVSGARSFREIKKMIEAQLSQPVQSSPRR